MTWAVCVVSHTPPWSKIKIKPKINTSIHPSIHPLIHPQTQTTNQPIHFTHPPQLTHAHHHHTHIPQTNKNKNKIGGEHGKFAMMISYGTFDFDFGVALMEYIMNKSVGLQCTVLVGLIGWVVGSQLVGCWMVRGHREQVSGCAVVWVG
jgi:hypothetical protein